MKKRPTFVLQAGLISMLFATGLQDAVAQPPSAPDGLEVVGTVDHVDAGANRIVVNDQTFLLSAGAPVRLANGRVADLRSLKKGMTVKFAARRADGPRPVVFEIQVLPEGTVVPEQQD